MRTLRGIPVPAALVLGALLGFPSAPVAAQDAPAPPADGSDAAEAEAAPPLSIALDLFGLDLDRLNTIEVETAGQAEASGAARPTEAAVAEAERALEQRAAAARAAEAGRAGRTPSPAALVFSRRLQEAIELELKAQELERGTLGIENLESLGGVRRERWLRIDRERDVRNRITGFTIAPLVVPQVEDAAARPREVLLVLARLQRAHEAARELRTLGGWIEQNTIFLRTNDFARRDGAVLLRDEVLEREAQYARLISDALELVATDSLELAADIEARLDELAPDSRQAAADIALLVLRDPELRRQAQAQVMALLTAAPMATAPPAEAEVLAKRIAALSQSLLEAAGMPPLLAEHEKISGQLEALDAMLRSSLPEERRKDLVSLRIELLTRSRAIEHQWLTTPPDPELWASLVASQDELIRRHQLDGGARAAFLAGRVDALDDIRPVDDLDPAAQWRFLDEQRDVLLLHEALRQSGDPLAGVTMPDTYGLLLLKDAKARLAAENEAGAKIAAAAAASKPTAGAKGKKPAPMAIKPKAVPKPTPKKPAPAKPPGGGGGAGGKPR